MSLEKKKKPMDRRRWQREKKTIKGGGPKNPRNEKVSSKGGKKGG